MNDFLTVQTSGFVTYCDALIARFSDGPAQALLFSLIGSPTQVQAASAHFYNGGLCGISGTENGDFDLSKFHILDRDITRHCFRHFKDLFLEYLFPVKILHGEAKCCKQRLNGDPESVCVVILNVSPSIEIGLLDIVILKSLLNLSSITWIVSTI